MTRKGRLFGSMLMAAVIVVGALYFLGQKGIIPEVDMTVMSAWFVFIWTGAILWIYKKSRDKAKRFEQNANQVREYTGYIEDFILLTY